MMAPVACSECNVEIPNNPASIAAPCPTCRSLARTYSDGIGLDAGVTFSGNAVVAFSTSPDRLISLAERLTHENDPDNFGVAVVVAHMAIELAISRKFSDVCAKRNLEKLDKAVKESIQGSSLKKGGHWTTELYIFLTGDEINQAPFWPTFAESNKLRNDVAHKGIRPSRAEAQRAIEVATAMVKHLAAV